MHRRWPRRSGEKEQAELEIIEGYLPEQVSEERFVRPFKPLLRLVMQQMGQIIGAVRERFNGAVDGARLAQITREELASKLCSR
ncbi:MAG: GatB/YqeY domain-containing protein [Candidatus Saccharibacteria bacterium]